MDDRGRVPLGKGRAAASLVRLSVRESRTAISTGTDGSMFAPGGGRLERGLVG
jgi:hypothetical protein